MAINDGRETPAKPANARVRVVVKLTERAMESGHGKSVLDATGRAQSELRRVVPNAEFRPCFEEEGVA